MRAHLGGAVDGREPRIRLIASCRAFPRRLIGRKASKTHESGEKWAGCGYRLEAVDIVSSRWYSVQTKSGECVCEKRVRVQEKIASIPKSTVQSLLAAARLAKAMLPVSK